MNGLSCALSFKQRKMNMTPAPTAEQDRIESLDVLRGFAVLGILLINILGFAIYSKAYLDPLFNSDSMADVVTWASMELLVEGAMRGLFSMLFGASLVLLTTGVAARGAWIFYKRNFWLLIFGFFNVYILLWEGDVLVAYALAGFLLYFVRNVRASRLHMMGAALLLLFSLAHAFLGFSMEYSREVSRHFTSGDGTPTAQDQEAIAAWEEFQADTQPSLEGMEEELAARSGSLVATYSWHFHRFAEEHLPFTLMFALWDAMMMMLFGMALYKSGMMLGQRSLRFYIITAVAGFASGLLINAYEVMRTWHSGFDVLVSLPFFQFSYHFGRLGIAFGWLGLILALLKLGRSGAVRRRLAAVGRMALTNYLMHSLVFMLIFTGAGLGLVGRFSRSEVYVFVLAMWAFQLWFSPWWLVRYRYGPTEWLWRGLTYGKFPVNGRSTPAETST